MNFKHLVLIIVTLTAVFQASASVTATVSEANSIKITMPVMSQMLKAKASFVEGENGLFEPLDLKAKSLRPRATISVCGDSLERKARTLNYSCTIKIPNKAKISRLQNLITSQNYEVTLGGLKKEVSVSVSSDARSITYSTKFDSTGIDFDVMKFNDDFFASNAKLAHIVLAEAMKQPVRIEVLESN